MQLVKLSSAATRERAKDETVLAAFIGWQMGAGGKKTFGGYLRHLGLSDELPQHEVSQERDDSMLSRMGIKKAKKVKK